MNIRTKYAVTAGVLIGSLVGAVTVGRSLNHPTGLGTDEAKAKGPAGAPVEVVEYSDFQCPACQTAREPLKKLLSQFPDEIRFHFRHYPLEQSHRWALAAAQFAECAAEQKLFWPFHDRLYDEQANWGNSPNGLVLFAQYARDVGLEFEALQICASNSEVLKRIRQEREEGTRLGVRSTPTFFINGKPLVGGAQLVAQGEALVREALENVKKVQSTE